MRRNLLSFLFRKMLMSTFFLRFKSNYLEKMRCYPNFSSWILTTLAKIYFSAWSKPGANCLVFSWHRPCVTLDHSIFVTQLCANLKGTDKTMLLLVFGCIWLSGTYTTRHLHQRISKHKHSAIGRRLEDHGLSKSDLKDKQFSVLRKCRSKFDCLMFGMLFIKELKPGLNTQKDSVRAQLFT